ncbi:MAG: hypothetical protein JST67_06540 [Bacteroidetes bacterium]|nr:hypothetical protein [Bacteroidota bacterium]
MKVLLNRDSVSLYKMQVYLFRRYYTGILMDKKINNTNRLVFVTELGMKIFDIKLVADSAEVVYCFSPLNKPKITNILKTDLQFLWLKSSSVNPDKMYENKNKEQIYIVEKNKKKYWYYISENKINKTRAKEGAFTNKKGHYSYTLNNEIEHAVLKHKGLLRLKIELQKIHHE